MNKMEINDILAFILSAFIIVAMILAILLIVVAYYTIASVVLMLAWNYAMTYAFNLPELGFLHALCIIIVFKILFSIITITKDGTKKSKD